MAKVLPGFMYTQTYIWDCFSCFRIITIPTLMICQSPAANKVRSFCWWLHNVWDNNDNASIKIPRQTQGMGRQMGNEIQPLKMSGDESRLI